MKDLILDIRRALYLMRIGLKYGTGPVIRHLLGLRPRGLAYAIRIRVALETLGLTYLKLGQFLAMRFDILPLEVCHELNKLFEHVPPMTSNEVKSAVETELRGQLQGFFPVFDFTPIAAASVAQVHEARTQANDRVAVKIQRPNIDRIFAADMRNLRRLAFLFDTFGLLGNLSMREALTEFSTYTSRELDCLIEGRTADRLREGSGPREIVPKIYWELTTARLITMEFVDGVSLAEIGDLLEAGKSELLKNRLPQFHLGLALHRLAFASLHQLFVTGFFHADPHPGNILIVRGNKVGWVDFGIFGELTSDRIEILAKYIENLALGNINESFRYYAKLYTPTEQTDERAFELEAKSILSRWYQAYGNPNSTVRERHLGRAWDEMLRAVRRHRLRMSMDTLLFWRALIALDSTALRLSPDFDLLRELRGFFERVRPDLGERLQSLAADWRRGIVSDDLGRGMLDRIARVLEDLPTDRFRVRCNVDESGPAARDDDALNRRLSGGVMGISLAILATVGRIDASVRAVMIALAFLAVMWSLLEWRRR
jgi:ubiquinone biosynthesis protein